MKLNENLKLEIKLHLIFFISTLPTVLLFYIGFKRGWFGTWPTSCVVGAGVFCIAASYLWWRHCLSPDKTKLIAKWW